MASARRCLLLLGALVSLHYAAAQDRLSQPSLPTTCEKGRKPYVGDDGKPVECFPANDTCPEMFGCSAQLRICCPRNLADDPPIESSPDSQMCGANGRLFKDKNGEPERCANDTDCLPPTMCLEGGYCCLLRLDQEPPPVGCPFGTRPLTNANNEQLTCTPGLPGSCPGDTLCYQDSLDGSHKCCGRDPGEGCPTGSKAVKANDRIIPCTPGSPTNGCSGKALCQWSYLIDRYQCCEADNGCPSGYAPLSSSVSTTQTCLPTQPGACPARARCEFNFWIADHQCCSRDLGYCDAGLVAYLDGGEPRQCNAGQAGACPSGYFCRQSTTGQSVCCGAVGQCPVGWTTETDAAGRALSCSFGGGGGGGCTSPSVCQQAVGGAPAHSLCCRQTRSVLRCVSGRQPYPDTNNPQQCTASFPTCPFNYACEQSTSAGVSICCGGSVTQSGCPTGWSLQGGVQQFCSPTGNNCQPGSTCLTSVVTANQFLCCVPLGTGNVRYTCPRGTPVQLGGGTYQLCGSGSQQCSAGSICQQATNAPGTFLCCRTSLSSRYTCPNGAEPYQVGGQYHFCSLSSSNCISGYECRRSPTAPSVSICCRAQANTGRLNCVGSGTPVITNGANQFCGSQSSQNCPLGSLCQYAAQSSTTQICCYGGRTSSYTCSNNGRLLTVGGQPQYCNLFQQRDTCNFGYTCTAAVSDNRVGLCCSSGSGGTSTYQCQSGRSPYLASSRQVIFCNPFNPTNCPASTSCERTRNSPQIAICCQSAATGGSQALCPTDQLALLDARTQQPEFCNSPTGRCSQLGYTCQISPRLARFVCCGRPSSAQCSNGEQPYRSPGGQLRTCNPSSAVACFSGYECVATVGAAAAQYLCCAERASARPRACRSGRVPYASSGNVLTCARGSSTCPPGSRCEQSDVSAWYICCRDQTPTTNDQLRCPVGWRPFMEASTGRTRTCNNLASSSCPAGYSCAQSNVNGRFLCCRFSASTTAVSCYNGRPHWRRSDDRPQVCTVQFDNCPSGYTCGASTQANTYICCADTAPTTSTNPLCLDGQRPFYGADSRPLSCTRPGSLVGCPNGFGCERSSQAASNVCCPVRSTTTTGGASSVWCGEGSSVAVSAAGDPVGCSRANPTCPAGFDCEYQQRWQRRYCCQGPRCPAGVTVGTPRTCQSSSSCPRSYQCVEAANIAQVSVCCPPPTNTPGTSAARCLGRGTWIVSGKAQSCQLPNTCANSNYECSAYSTTGQYICCEVVANSAEPVCADNRDPYRDPESGEFHYCDNTNFACPEGFECKRQLNSIDNPNRFVCCTPEASCQRGWLPYREPATGKAQRCSPFQQNRACTPRPGQPFRCQQSTVPNTFLCCREAARDGLNDAEVPQNGTAGDSGDPLDWWQIVDGMMNNRTDTTTVDPSGTADEWETVG